MPINVGAYTAIRTLSTVAALIVAITFLGVTMVSSAGSAQTQATEANAGPALSDEQLDELVGPIALYPDELLAITLPGSTYPLEIVQAARYLEKRKNEPELKPDEKWDSSVLGLLNYPDVIEKMNQDLDWTSRLGDAVINHQSDLMDAIQRFRAEVYAAGNLKSDGNTTIVQEKEIIKIVSASTEVIYVPAYNPTVVVVQQPAPYAYVYSPPYPYYYNPAATFWTGMFVGAAIGYGIGWRGRGHNDINIDRNVNISGNTINRGSGNKWNSNRRPGGQVGRPGTRPGGRSGARSGTKSRAGVGARPAGQSKRAVSKQPSRQQRGSGGQARRKQGQGGSMGTYKNGRSAKQYSNRGQRSRASRSSNRNSRSSRGRSSRGRSSGGRRGRR